MAGIGLPWKSSRGRQYCDEPGSRLKAWAPSNPTLWKDFQQVIPELVVCRTSARYDCQHSGSRRVSHDTAVNCLSYVSRGESLEGDVSWGGIQAAWARVPLDVKSPHSGTLQEGPTTCRPRRRYHKSAVCHMFRPSWCSCCPLMLFLLLLLMLLRRRCHYGRASWPKSRWSSSSL